MDKYNILFLEQEFETVCNKLQNIKLRSKIVELKFKEVLDFVIISNREIQIKPFTTKVNFNDFYNFLFLEDENGVSKHWISLNLVIKFPADNFAFNLRVKDDLAVISTNELIQYNYLIEVLSPYSDVSLEEKLKILNIENQRENFEVIYQS